MKKVANKIALIIVVLLVVSLAVFSTVSYTNTKGNIYDLAKESKASASKVLQFYMNAFFEDKVATVENFAKYLESHPEILDDREALKKELMTGSRATDFSEFYFAYAEDGAAYNAVLDGDERKFMVFDQKKTMMQELETGIKTLLQKRALSSQLHTQARLVA